MDSSTPRPSRRFRRLFGRLTAATLGAASVAATPAADLVDDGDPPGLAAPDHPDADDGVDPRAAAAAHWLAVSLDRMTPLARTYTACRWALSGDAEQRLTIAGALEWTPRVVGDGVIVDHLSRDDDARVRAAIARAAWTRHGDPTGDEALHRLAADPEPEVREIARLAMRGR